MIIPNLDPEKTVEMYVSVYLRRDLNPECEHGLLVFLFNSSTETQQLNFRRIERYFSDLNGLLNNLNSCRTRECDFCHLS